MYKERMLNYYPWVIRSIYEFQAIVSSEAPEFEELHTEVRDIIDDAWLTTMGIDRIIQWENILGIKPLEGSTDSDRREVVIARIRGQGKLNTALINSIVKVFTGGTAKSWVANSTLYVEITPPPNNKQFKFPNVEQEIAKKIPAHLGFNIRRAYNEWVDIKNNCTTWGDVKETFNTWNDVLLITPDWSNE